MHGLLNDALKLPTPDEVIKQYNEKLKEEGRVSPSDFVDFNYVELQEGKHELHNVKILQCFQEDTTKTHTENWTENNSSYGMQYHNKSVSTVQKRTFALVGRMASDVISDMAISIHRIAKEKSDIEEKCSKDEEIIKDLQKTVTEKNDTIQRLQSARQATEQNVIDLREKQRLYEADMGKLRRALGELKLNEILGGA